MLTQPPLWNTTANGEITMNKKAIMASFLMLVAITAIVGVSSLNDDYSSAASNFNVNGNAITASEYIITEDAEIFGEIQDWQTITVSGSGSGGGDFKNHLDPCR